jgi:hypothetical protein
MHNADRYKRWLNYYYPLMEELGADNLFFIDDGGREVELPVNTLLGNLPEQLSGNLHMYCFPNALGRLSDTDFPGWWRSFLFSMEIARKYGYKKFIHIESDCFLFTPRLLGMIRELKQGWSSLYSRYYGFPETCVQVICEDAYPLFDALKEKVTAQRFTMNEYAELTLPFTNVMKEFIGDRLGEESVLAGWLDHYPLLLSKLDFAAQMNARAAIPVALKLVK